MRDRRKYGRPRPSATTKCSGRPDENRRRCRGPRAIVSCGPTPSGGRSGHHPFPAVLAMSDRFSLVEVAALFAHIGRRLNAEKDTTPTTRLGMAREGFVSVQVTDGAGL